MSTTKFWRVYLLKNDKDMHFRSVEMESDSGAWEILSTQVFTKDNNHYISVLWDTHGNSRPAF